MADKQSTIWSIYICRNGEPNQRKSYADSKETKRQGAMLVKRPAGAKVHHRYDHQWERRCVGANPVTESAGDTIQLPVKTTRKSYIIRRSRLRV